jgi:hypothetical protein
MTSTLVNPLDLGQPTASDLRRERISARLNKHPSNKETAAIKAVPSGTCPACGKRMGEVIANGIPSHVCYDCRVALPRPN